jgi:AbiV family abortive infection protein
MPRKKAGGPLTAEQLGAIAEMSLANASELIAEARGLLEADAIARSYSIAVPAGEEFGKCQLAIGTVGRGPEDANYWKEWWSVFYGHGPKLARAAALATRFLPVELVETFVTILESGLKQQRRESGFYVDFAEGRPLSPAEAIKPQEALGAIRCFGTMIDLYATVFENVGLAQAFQNVDAGRAREMRPAVESRDRERIRNTWEGTIGRRPDDVEIHRIMALLDDDG